jgi:hypothetical protein
MAGVRSVRPTSGAKRTRSAVPSSAQSHTVSNADPRCQALYFTPAPRPPVS